MAFLSRRYRSEMPEYYSSRIFLLDPSGREEAVAAVAEKLGWPRLGVVPEDAAALAPYEVIWGKSQDLALHYREDFLTKSPCALVTGADERQVETAARFVEARLK